MKIILPFSKATIKGLIPLTLICATMFFSSMRIAPIATSLDNRIIGVWLSSEKDLKVEIYKQNDAYFGKIVWFACEPQTPDMNAFKDTENPNPALRGRKWLGLNVLKNLTYNNKGYWSGGEIYDPNTGSTYNTTVRLLNNDQVSVKGYWGIELIGKNMEFHRISK